MKLNYVIKWIGYLPANLPPLGYVYKFGRGKYGWTIEISKALKFKTKKDATSFIKKHFRNGSFGGELAKNLSTVEYRE